MQFPTHISLATPLPAVWKPEQLLGRLVVDPQLTVTTIDAQLNPSPSRVGIRAKILDDSYKMEAGLEAKKHVFAPGSARVWNTMLDNDRSLSAIRALLAKNPEAWLVTTVFTAGDSIVALDCARVRRINSEFVVELDDACVPFLKKPPTWFERHLPTAIKVLKYTALAAAAALATYITVQGILAVAGFGAGGVVAGSVAAGWQATIGNVVAGSAFAGLQSLGAVGLSAGVAAACGVGVAAVTAWLTHSDVTIINL